MKKTVDFDGRKISYSVYGEGNPVILLHGFGEDDSVWRNQVPFLQQDFRVIIPQLPGTGDSDLLEEMSMETMAASVMQIADAEGLGSFVVIGHSMGGYTTLAFAEKYMDRLKAFGLYHSNSIADSEEKKTNRRKGVDFVKKYGALAFLKSITPNLFSETTKNNNPDLVIQTMNNIPAFSDESVIAYYKAMMARRNRTNVLETSLVPVLFVIGKGDSLIPYQDALHLSTLPDKSYIYTLQNSGHLSMLEEPEESNKALKEF
ncbi:MAG: alpha/beta hydrolase [Sphingobacteriales bacterium]|nr:alpha/beta hydrolase [Sphingobacteriales bacterium]